MNRAELCSVFLTKSCEKTESKEIVIFNQKLIFQKIRIPNGLNTTVASQSVSQSVNQSVSQSVSFQSINLSASQLPASQSVSQLQSHNVNARSMASRTKSYTTLHWLVHG